MADHSPPGWWDPPRRGCLPIVVAAFLAAALLMKGFIVWVR